jgi:hypothetical protein
MEQLALFSGTLGLAPPWYVTSVTFARDASRLDISVEYGQLAPVSCPFCGEQAVSYTEAESETWFHANFFDYATYLHARVPRLPCCCRTLPRPWCRAGSRFARLPE